MSESKPALNEEVHILEEGTTDSSAPVPTFAPRLKLIFHAAQLGLGESGNIFKTRKPEVVMMRNLAMFFARVWGENSYPKIAQFSGLQHHTSVMYGISVAAKALYFGVEPYAEMLDETREMERFEKLSPIYIDMAKYICDVFQSAAADGFDYAKHNPLDKGGLLTRHQLLDTPMVKAKGLGGNSASDEVGKVYSFRIVPAAVIKLSQLPAPAPETF